MNRSKKQIVTAIIIGSIIPLLFLGISIYTMNDYGETTDEKASQISGGYYYYQWGKQESVEDYMQSFSVKDRNYGPLFDTLSVASHDLLNQKTGLIHNPVASYHVPAIAASVLALAIVFVFAWRTWGFLAGFLSALTLALMPRFIGDSQNNIKDTPILMLFSAVITLYVAAVQKKSMALYMLAGIALGMTYATKINALILIPVVLVWFTLCELRSWKDLWTFAKGYALSLAASVAGILLFWPYYRYHPLTRFLETFHVFENHEWNDYVLYLGRHYRGHDIPRTYPFVMFGVTTPVFFLILLGVALVITVYAYTTPRLKRYRSPLTLLTIWMLSTPVIQALSRNPMYDGIRHFQASLAPMAILIGFTVWYTGTLIMPLKPRFRTPLLSFFALLCVIGYGGILRTDIRIHPYQIVYFNELVGGTRGAYRSFDLDYWGQSLQEAASWIHKNLPAGSRLHLTNYMEHHFPIDRSRYAMVTRYPQYKINLLRGTLHELDTDDDYLHPRRNIVHEIRVDGAPVLQIFGYPENRIAPDAVFAPLSPAPRSPTRGGLTKTVYDNTTFTSPAINTVVDASMKVSCEDPSLKDKPASIAYEGYLRIPRKDSYCFHVEADDEAVLKLDGQIVLISPTLNTTDRKVEMLPGLHTFRLEYVNDLSNGCYRLTWSSGSCESFTEISTSDLYY